MANPVQFWLSYNNKAEVLQLPVNPASLKISGSHGMQDIDVNGIGEYTVIGDPKLNEYSFSSFFPRDYNSTYCEYIDIPDPWAAAATLEEWRDSRRPIRLTVTGTPINTPVTIRSFSYDVERGGSPGDLYFDLTLKEYVFIDFSRLRIGSGSSSSGSSRPDDTEQPKSHTVAAGDSLWKIAQRVYGDGSKYAAIYEANKSKIGKDPSRISVGMELILP